eukprot:g12862.t1
MRFHHEEVGPALRMLWREGSVVDWRMHFLLGMATMLKFAQLGPAEEEQLRKSGIDRAKLRIEYEAALSLLQHRASEAAELLRRLVFVSDDQGVPLALTADQRDRVWLQRFHVLCLQNLGAAQQVLVGKEQQALASLKAAVKASLWRQLADAAATAGDWQTATEAE